MNPKTVEEKIPKTKSKPLDFKCNNCQEEISIWLEGNKKILDDTKIISCPNCGAENTLERIQ